VKCTVLTRDRPIYRSTDIERQISVSISKKWYRSVSSFNRILALIPGYWALCWNLRILTMKYLY